MYNSSGNFNEYSNSNFSGGTADEVEADNTRNSDSDDDEEEDRRVALMLERGDEGSGSDSDSDSDIGSNNGRGRDGPRQGLGSGIGIGLKVEVGAGAKLGLGVGLRPGPYSGSSADSDTNIGVNGGSSGVNGGSSEYAYEDDFEASYESEEEEHLHLQGQGEEGARGFSAPLGRAAPAAIGITGGARATSAPLPVQSVSSVNISNTGNANANANFNGANPSTAVRRKAASTPSWIVKRKWVIGERIGHGSFGEVFQGMSHTGRLFAVKQLHIVGQRNNVVDTLTNEISLMRAYAHPNIVGYLGADVDETAGIVNIFQEWVSGGSLAHLLTRFGSFKERAVINYTRQILQGLAFLHANGIIHRDVKGGNVLVDESGHVKLADFGASTKVNALTETTIETLEIKGTPYFMAPEVIGKSRYGRKGDIWAVGCTMIQMLTACPPWKDKNLNGLVQLHILLESWEGPPDYPKEHVSSELQAVIALCFQKDEKSRPSAQALLDNPLFGGLLFSGTSTAAGAAAGAGSGSAGRGRGSSEEEWLEDSEGSPVKPRKSHAGPNRRLAAVAAVAAGGGGGGRTQQEQDEELEFLEDSGVMEDMRMQLSRLVRSQDAPLPPSQQQQQQQSQGSIRLTGAGAGAGVGIAGAGSGAGTGAAASPASLCKPPASANGRSPNPYARSNDRYDV